MDTKTIEEKTPLEEIYELQRALAELDAEPYLKTIPEGIEPYDSGVIKRVTDVRGGYVTIEWEGGGISLPIVGGIIPKVGQHLELFGSLGFQVRGARIDGEVLYWRDEEMERQHHEQWKARYKAGLRRKWESELRAQCEADFEKLPEPLKKRIAKFRADKPDTRWEWEPYEMFATVEAARIAEHYQKSGRSEITYPAGFDGFCDLWDELTKKEVVSREHTNNTFGGAVGIARWLLAGAKEDAA